MHLSALKQEFSFAFVHAIATLAGVTLERRSVDLESLDLLVMGNRDQGSAFSLPHLNVQAKCTETDDGKSDHVTYALPIKNYNDLRAERVHVPQVLVVLCVPKKTSSWAKHTAAQLALKKCAYWLDLKGKPEVPNTTSCTVHLPRSQVFSATSLSEMLSRISSTGSLT